MTIDKDELPKSFSDNDTIEKFIEKFRLSLIQKAIFSNWLKILLIYGTAGGIAGGALSAAITGSLVLANVLTVGFFTVTPVLPILIIAAVTGVTAFLATVAYKATTDVINNHIPPKDLLKIYKKFETNKDGKTYVEDYFEKNNLGLQLKEQSKENMKNILNKWRYDTWKESEENKKNWQERYTLEYNNQENHRKIRRI